MGDGGDSNRVIPNPQSNPADAAVIAPVTALSPEFTAGPNPIRRGDRWSPAVKFFCHGKRIDDAVLTIYDASGNFIRKIAIADKSAFGQARRQVGEWDLKDSKGRPVGEGMYVVKGVLRSANGKSEKVSVVLGVR